jgi:hypothetical protein
VAKFVLVVLLFAGAVYLLLWARERRRALGGGGRRGRGPGRLGGRPQSRPVAPDDDEDFLRWLDRKRPRDGGDNGAPT